MERQEFRINKRSYDIGMERRDNGRIYLSIPYALKDLIVPEVKESFEKVKWHGFDDRPEKFWSFPETQRNIFRFLYYTGLQKPYEWYDHPLQLLPSTDGAYTHQTMLTSMIVQYRQVYIGSEMGTGKTRATFDALKYLKCPDVWWAAPKSALYSLMLEQEKWDFLSNIRFITYQGLTKIVDNWTKGEPPPRALILDESQRVKSAKAKCTNAARHLANAMRTTHGRDAVIVCLTGTPSPKSPVDHWSQAEIACPGFLREGHPDVFKRRLCLTVEATNNITGTTYPKLVTWWDDSNKCQTCGQLKGDPYHNMQYYFKDGPYHKFTESINEVEKVSARLKGLMTVVLKRDVLKELPEKVYKTIYCTPSQSTVRQARMVVQMETRGAMALTILRELSDGFQYENIKCGEETCPVCDGTGTLPDSKYIGPEYDEFDLPNPDVNPEYFVPTIVTCRCCDGTKVVPLYAKEAKQVATPKEQVLTDLLDEYADEGRMIVWAGFHGSIDRCEDIIRRSKHKWDAIIADGRGWRCSWANADGSKVKPHEMLKAFQNRKYGRKIVYLGHPGAGGTGVTLTASTVAVYYSNDFNFENRAQSEDRGHRPGMDINKGFTVIDIVHLPSDQYVIDNLKRKMKLQAVSIGDLHTALNTVVSPDRGYGVRLKAV